MSVAEELHRADALTFEGKGAEAATLIETSALPKARENAASAQAVQMTTPWGTQLSAEVSTHLNNRSESAERYLTALRSQEINQFVAALDAQKAIEQQGMTLNDKLKTAPAESGCGR